jgi:16S rRNA processing protein RimM
MSPEENSQAGGTQPTAGGGKAEFLVVGKLHRPHGIRGEVILEILTDFPERLHRGLTVYIGPQHQPLRLRSLRQIEEGLLVSFQGYEGREAVGELRNQLVMVRTDDRPPLEEGEYYHHQILGLRVIDERGQFLGNVVEILETGANDVLVIRPEQGEELLLPMLESTVLSVDLESGEMHVHLLPGLRPGEEETE